MKFEVSNNFETVEINNKFFLIIMKHLIYNTFFIIQVMQYNKVV